MVGLLAPLAPARPSEQRRVDHRIAVGVTHLLNSLHLSDMRVDDEISRRKLILQAAAVLGLYLANFVAAGGAMDGVMMIESRYTVWVVNQSAMPLESARVAGGGVDV